MRVKARADFMNGFAATTPYGREISRRYRMGIDCHVARLRPWVNDIVVEISDFMHVSKRFVNILFRTIFQNANGLRDSAGRIPMAARWLLTYRITCKTTNR